MSVLVMELRLLARSLRLGIGAEVVFSFSSARLQWIVVYQCSVHETLTYHAQSMTVWVTWRSSSGL